MDRVEIKTKAKKIVQENLANFWKGYIIIIAISFLCSFAIGLLFDENSIIYSCLTLVSSFFTATLSIGFNSYVLKMVRNESYDRNDIFKFVGKVLPIAAISLLTTIFVFLWSILFIIPGIIAAVGYSMAFMIFIDNENLSPMECLSESKKMMQGYKMDYFIFGLSFLGWIIVGILTLGIGLIWVLPYVTIAEAIYYDDLKKKREKEK